MLLASVSSTPKKISSAAAVICPNRRPETAIAKRGQNDLPLAFELVGDSGGGQRSERRGDGDDERIAQAAGDGDAALDQQRRHPVGEAIESDGLKQMKDDQHDAARSVWRPPHFREAMTH